jgi:tRNA pseudouridine65 synthase
MLKASLIKSGMQRCFPPLTILYQDEWFVAVNKPPGMLVHKSFQAPDRRTCMNLLRDQIGSWVYPLHRLDRKTSGVVLFALSSEAAKSAGELFAGRDMHKVYHTVVRGWTEESGYIDSPLVDMDSGVSREAQTSYRRLSTVEWPEPCGRYSSGRFSLVEAIPHTGRPHQIRRHMRHIQHPVIGDTAHGDGAQNRFFRAQFNSHRMLLHASCIQFLHPVTAQPINIQAPLEQEFIEVCERFNWPNFSLQP